MRDRTCATPTTPSTPLSQPDEFLRRALAADAMSPADRQAHAAATHVTTSGLTRTSRATLTRLTTALGV